MWNKGLLQAIEVAKMVEQLLPKKVDSTIIFGESKTSFICTDWYNIESYQNCREQGITIWIPWLNGIEGPTFSICQHRSTDMIGYYVGKHVFHGISDEAYKGGFHSFESSQDCANAIAEYIDLLIKRIQNI